MRVRLAPLAAVALLCVSAAAFAESPRGNASTTINGKKVVIDYGRPALKGRALADLLKQLPEDRIWRAGDDQVTTLSTDTALSIGDKKIPAGKYSLYVHLPEDGSRALVVNTDLGQPLVKLWAQAPPDRANLPWPHLEGYQKSIADKEVVRAKMAKEEAKSPVDVFTVSFSPAKDGAKLNLAWGEESWSLDVKGAK